MSINEERIAYCIGWLEGFSTTVWALLSTDAGGRLVDSEAGGQYDAHVAMLRNALYAPVCLSEDGSRS